MLPRPSTTISFHASARLDRSACLTIEPSGSRRVSSLPVTSRRPSGSQSIDQPRPPGPCATTSLLPSRSTATISSVPQWANQSRPSCQRGDSPITRSLNRTWVSGADIWTSSWNWTVRTFGDGTDPQLAAAHFDWLVMSSPLNRAMFLGEDDPPTAAELDRYAGAGV